MDRLELPVWLEPLARLVSRVSAVHQELQEQPDWLEPLVEPEERELPVKMDEPVPRDHQAEQDKPELLEPRD